MGTTKVCHTGNDVLHFGEGNYLMHEILKFFGEMVLCLVGCLVYYGIAAVAVKRNRETRRSEEDPGDRGSGTT